MVEVEKNEEARKSLDENRESELWCPDRGGRLMGPNCTNGDSSHPVTCRHLAFFPFSCEIKCEGNMFCSACVGGGVGVV